jgi:hypothetical protein
MMVDRLKVRLMKDLAHLDIEIPKSHMTVTGTLLESLTEHHEWFSGLIVWKDFCSYDGKFNGINFIFNFENIWCKTQTINPTFKIIAAILTIP